MQKPPLLIIFPKIDELGSAARIVTSKIPIVMKCPHCGAENPSNAKYCQACGKSFYSMKTCPKCGQQTPSDGKYCIHCQAKLAPDGKIEHSLFSKASFAVGCLLILWSLVFTFLISARANVTLGGDAEAIAGTKVDVFAFFGKVYKQMVWDSDAIIYQLMGPAFSTLAIGVFMIIVVVSALVSIKAMVGFGNGKTPSITKAAGFVYLSYVGTVAIFMLAIARTASAGLSFSYLLDTTSIAGLAIGAILFFIAVLLDGIGNRSDFKVGSAIGRLLCTAIIIGFGAGTIALLAQGIYTGTTDNNSLAMGIYPLGETLYEKACSLVVQGGEALADFNATFAGLAVVLLIGIILAIIFLSTFAQTLARSLENPLSPHKKEAGSAGIMAGTGAILYGVIQLDLNLAYVDFIGMAKEASIINGALMIVFGLAIMIASIVLRSLSSKEAKR